MILPFCFSLASHEVMALSGTDVLSLKFIDCTSDFGIGPLNGKDDEYELVESIRAS